LEFEEFSRDLKIGIFTRFSSPLISHFIYAWSIFNWKVFVAVFVGDTDAFGRLEYINKNIEVEILAPLCAALVWVFIWPFINEYIVEFTEWRRSKLLVIRKDYSDQQYLTLEESISVREKSKFKVEKIKNLLKETELEFEGLQNEYNKLASNLTKEELSEVQDEDNDDNEGSESFLRPLVPSLSLSKIVGNEPLSRVDVVKKVWAYIKENKLQDSENRRNINADDVLEEVFDGKKQISMFEMTKLLSKHLKEKD